MHLSIPDLSPINCIVIYNLLLFHQKIFITGEIGYNLLLLLLHSLYDTTPIMGIVLIKINFQGLIILE